jgi:hypothetical protein
MSSEIYLLVTELIECAISAIYPNCEEKVQLPFMTNDGNAAAVFSAIE